MYISLPTSPFRQTKSPGENTFTDNIICRWTKIVRGFVSWSMISDHLKLQFENKSLQKTFLTVLVLENYILWSFILNHWNVFIKNSKAPKTSSWLKWSDLIKSYQVWPDTEGITWKRRTLFRVAPLTCIAISACSWKRLIWLSFAAGKGKGFQKLL